MVCKKWVLVGSTSKTYWLVQEIGGLDPTHTKVGDGFGLFFVTSEEEEKKDLNGL